MENGFSDRILRWRCAHEEGKRQPRLGSERKSETKRERFGQVIPCLQSLLPKNCSTIPSAGSSLCFHFSELLFNQEKCSSTQAGKLHASGYTERLVSGRERIGTAQRGEKINNKSDNEEGAATGNINEEEIWGQVRVITQFLSCTTQERRPFFLIPLCVYLQRRAFWGE
jgi:hypothetical protein